jgi:DNA primase
MREELLIQKDEVEALRRKNGLTHVEKRFLSERKENEEKLQKQMDVFEHALRRDLFALKEAHVRQKIAEIRIHIGQLTKDGKIDEAIERMKLLSVLNTIKIELSKELGERIVLKM